VDAFPDPFRSRATCVSGGRAYTLGFDRSHEALFLRWLAAKRSRACTFVGIGRAILL
jgi:hypothetical protein